MDLLDALQGTGKQTFRGKYFRRIPNPVDVWSQPIYEEAERSAIEFFYEYVDPQTKSYRQSIQNVISRANADTVIKTRFSGVYSGSNGNIEGFVRLQDGSTFVISQMQQDISTASKQAAFFCPVPVGCEYYLTLTRIDDPFADYSNSDTFTHRASAVANYVSFSVAGLEMAQGQKIYVYDGYASGEGVTLRGHFEISGQEEIVFYVSGAPATARVLCESGKIYLLEDKNGLFAEFSEPTATSGITVDDYESGETYTTALLSVTADGTISLESE